MNSDRWMESKGTEVSQHAIKFPHLPGGEKSPKSVARIESLNPNKPVAPSPSPPRSGGEGWGEVALIRSFSASLRSYVQVSGRGGFRVQGESHRMFSIECSIFPVHGERRPPKVDAHQDHEPARCSAAVRLRVPVSCRRFMGRAGVRASVDVIYADAIKSNHSLAGSNYFIAPVQYPQPPRERKIRLVARKIRRADH